MAEPIIEIHKGNSDPFLDDLFIFSELNYATEHTNKNSAPGLDGVDYRMLEHMTPKIRLILLNIFNNLYAEHQMPKEWAEAQVHFIPKQEKQKLRSIALTSCVCKTFERLIKTRLEWWSEHNNLIYPTQSGFRKGRKKKNKTAVAALLDVNAAFDNVQCQHAQFY